jgi:hypothetical protein
VRELPLTDEVIARVNELGADQKQPEVHNGRLLFEWHPGLPVDGDLDLIFDHFPDQADNHEDDHAIIIPDPIPDQGDRHG